MAELQAFITNNGVPLVAPVDAPEITVRRVDTQAIVQAATGMTEIGEGKYSFTFAIPDTAVAYSFSVDGDPNVSGQVSASERFQGGSFDGEVDITATSVDIAGLNNLSIADVQTAMDNQGYTAARGPLLDNLDATITSRATQTSVDAIQNNTRFAGIVPPILKLPDAGAKTYRLFARLFDMAGNPEDPDANVLNIRIENVAGGILQATVAMTRTGPGLYQFDYVVNSTDTEQALNVFFEYDEAAIAFQHVRTTEVSEFESKLDIIQTAVTVTLPAQIGALNDLSIADVQTALTTQGYTAARALLLDNLTNLDATISSVVTAIGALNNISVADILSAVLGSGNTVDAELSAVLLLRSFIEGGRDIDFVGSDVLGWQRIERDIGGTLIRRYNLFDEAGARINETVSSFIDRQGMISSEVPI